MLERSLFLYALRGFFGYAFRIYTRTPTKKRRVGEKVGNCVLSALLSLFLIVVVADCCFSFFFHINKVENERKSSKKSSYFFPPVWWKFFAPFLLQLNTMKFSGTEKFRKNFLLLFQCFINAKRKTSISQDECSIYNIFGRFGRLESKIFAFSVLMIFAFQFSPFRFRTSLSIKNLILVTHLVESNEPDTVFPVKRRSRAKI